MDRERDNPYVGPRTFEEKDSDYFFGRDEEAKALRSLVLGHRVVLFYATSGAGKSSLVNARIVPELREDQFMPLRARVSSGQRPEAIAAADNPYVFNLLSNLSPDVPAESLQHITLSEYMQTHHQIPADAEKSFLDPARILIIDQFEELVTTNQMYWEKRGDFFRQLSQAMEQDELLWVLLVMREDYVTELESYAHLIPGKLKVRYHMERMREQAALQALKEPASKAGRPYYEGKGGLPGSAEMLLWDLRQVRVAGSDDTVTGEFVEPVQLQLICYSLWEELRSRPGDVISPADVEAAANVDNTLGDYYNGAIRRIIEQTGVDEQALRDWFGEHLITETDTRGLVFRGDTHTEGMDNNVVDVLTGEFFLLRSSTIGGGTWYELVHDRFIPAIRQSNEEAWTIMERQRRDEALQAQQESFDQEKRKLMKTAAFILVPATVVITVFAVIFLIVQNRNLDAAKKEAEAALERERAGAGVVRAAADLADANLQTAQAAVAQAAADGTEAAKLAEDMLLQQQKESLEAQSTRWAELQLTQTALYQGVGAQDSTTPVATANPTRVQERAATATALVEQLAAVEAKQTAVAQQSKQEAVAATATAEVIPSSITIGSSVDGVPIEARRFGNGEKKIVLVGGIHAGLAPNTVELVEIAAEWFAKNESAIPASLTVYTVYNANPDSPRAIGQLEGRFNANGVDLNRNWDCDWNQNPIIRGERRQGRGGEEPLSEPETQALAIFLERVSPDAVVFYDAAVRGGFLAPGGCTGINEVAALLSEAYAGATGYGYDDININDIEGDVTNWLDLRGIPAFFVLLPDRIGSHWETNLAGIMALFEVVAQDG
jgi:hypothetical protein